MPQMTSYEEGNDPVGHLDRYTFWMELQGANEAIMCRAFPLTFRNRAMRWFKKLPQHSIQSWNDMSSQFISTFMGARARSTPNDHLVSIKQGRIESLRSYMDRFSKRIVEVDKISDDAALMAVLSVGGSQHLEGSKRQRHKLTREAHTSYLVLSSAIAKSDEEKFSFSKEDASHVLQPHSDALVITMPVSRINIHQTLVDDGSSVNVLYLRTFRQIEIDVRHVRPFTKPLKEFTEDYVNPKRQITLVVELELHHRRPPI
ncbi:Ribonuclease H [Abeliophyllum distichum]|uniref:Ribonuclease H n=1 Tax=Abeliophyllum distichum TaxID=126358 RepID=A0ABD1V547_9LAMI